MIRGRGLGQGKLVHTESYAGQKVWFGHWKGADGRRHRRILSQDKRTAQRLMEQILHERTLSVAGLQAEGAMEEPVAGLVDRYQIELRTYRTQSYVERTARNLRDVLAALGPIRVRELKVSMLLERRKKRIAKGASIRTANMEIASFKAALNWCVRTGLLASNPVRNLVPLKSTEADRKKRRRALSEIEIGKFLRAAEDLDRDRAATFAAEKTIAGGTKGLAWSMQARRQPLPQATLFKTIIIAGLRFGEAAAVRWCDLDADAGVLVLRCETTKSGKTRQIPVPRYLVGDLLALRDAQTQRFGFAPSPTEHIFLSVMKASPISNHKTLDLFRRILKRAGIDDIDEQGRQLDVHALRGTAATRMLRAGVSLPIVAELLGHSDVRLTMKHYTDLRVDDTRRAVAGVPEAVAAAATSAGAKVTAG